MSTLNVDTINKADGTDRQEACKAWVLYEQSTPAISDSYGVDSVSDDGAGIFTVNFTTDFATTNYIACGACMDGNTSSTRGGDFCFHQSGDTYTVSACQMTSGFGSTGSVDGGYTDKLNGVAFFGDQ